MHSAGAQGTAGSARLTSRPSTPTEPRPNGKVRFDVAGSSAAAWFPPVPAAGAARPLILFLHGANRTVDVFLDRHIPIAAETGCIVLAPFAREGSWDAIGSGEFAADPRILDASLRWVFQRALVDPSRILISGFSDGGTYALAIGRANGDLFPRIAAYSPGYLIDVAAVRRPAVLISHGTDDTILPIERTSRVIVPKLRRAGYEVDYREFDGPHAVRTEIVAEIARDLARDRSPRRG